MLYDENDLPNLPSIELDWESYYNDFDQKHGGNPVEHEDRLLYQDGWGFSLRDYAGPEYPPRDAEEAHRLAIAYWRIKLSEALRYHAAVKARYNLLREWQDKLSGILHERRTWQGEDGEFITQSMPVPFESYEVELEQYKSDITSCRRKLGELVANGHTTKRKPQRAG